MGLGQPANLVNTNAVRSLRLGGNWNNGANDGFSNANANNAPSNGNANYGGGLPLTSVPCQKLVRMTWYVLTMLGERFYHAQGCTFPRFIMN